MHVLRYGREGKICIKGCAWREDCERICFAFALACVVGKNPKTPKFSPMADDTITQGSIGSLVSLVCICDNNPPPYMTARWLPEEIPWIYTFPAKPPSTTDPLKLVNVMTWHHVWNPQPFDHESSAQTGAPQCPIGMHCYDTVNILFIFPHAVIKCAPNRPTSSQERRVNVLSSWVC